MLNQQTFSDAQTTYAAKRAADVTALRTAFADIPQLGGANDEVRHVMRAAREHMGLRCAAAADALIVACRSRATRYSELLREDLADSFDRLTESDTANIVEAVRARAVGLANTGAIVGAAQGELLQERLTGRLDAVSRFATFANEAEAHARDESNARRRKRFSLFRSVPGMIATAITIGGFGVLVYTNWSAMVKWLQHH